MKHLKILTKIITIYHLEVFLVKILILVNMSYMLMDQQDGG
jgi:hypothetical protein